MEKKIALIVPKLTHHLKSAKWNMKQLKKWKEEYEYAWRRLYGNIKIKDTIKLIPRRWRILKILDRETKRKIRTMEPELYNRLEEEMSSEDWTTQLCKTIPKVSESVIKFMEK